MTDAAFISTILRCAPRDVTRALESAIRRSEPDAFEVYGVIHGQRFVGRLQRDGSWALTLEEKP